jgi:hypothetical protein
MDDIDMRMFAQRAGASVTYAAGSVVFNKGDPGSCMYVVQSGELRALRDGRNGTAHPRHGAADVDQAALARKASRTGHTCHSPQAGQRARTVCWRMRSSVLISLSTPLSIWRPVVGQTKMRCSMASFRRRISRLASNVFLRATRRLRRGNKKPEHDVVRMTATQSKDILCAIR